VCTGWVGTGEARLSSLVSEDRSYKPMVKSSGGQRESDGVVVPGRGVEPSRAPGKGSDFGHVGNGGKREGMTGTAPSNYPDGHQPAVKVRRLQNRLWAAAKPSSGRRFHALYDRIDRPDVLMEAWERVRANRWGCPGRLSAPVCAWESPWESSTQHSADSGVQADEQRELSSPDGRRRSWRATVATLRA
jgi:hypothetical protein